MNDFEKQIASPQYHHHSRSTAEAMIEAEEKDQLCAQANVERLRVLRFFLVQAPPVLTMDAKLGNLCNP